MNYHNITHDDMLNGSGLRVVLWVSGCSHACPNCQNPQTWPISSGIPFDSEAKNELFEQLSHDYIKGITFSGGDPLHLNNLGTVTDLAQEIRYKFPDKDIWVYTGYRWEEVKSLPLMHYIDVLVDGPFVEAMKDVNAPWVGSTNQRVIDVPASLEHNAVIEKK